MVRRSAEFMDLFYLAVAERYGHATLHVRMDLRRGFAAEALRRAARHIEGVFPVLGCRYEPAPWRDHWVSDDSPIEYLVHAETADDRAPFHGQASGPAAGDDVDAWVRMWINRPLDPCTRRPFRVAQVERPGAGATLLVSVAHLAADGAGTMAIVHAFVCSLLDVPPVMPPSTDRGLRQLVRALPWSTLVGLSKDVADEAMNPFRLPFLRPRVPALTSGSERPAIHYRTVTIDGARYAALRKVCASAGATVNDGLLALVAIVTKQLSQHGPVAVFYTADMRRALAEPRAIAANLSGGQFVFLPRARVGEFASTAAAVARFTRDHKRRVPGMAMALLQTLSFSWLPHGLVRNVAVLPFEKQGAALFRRSLLFSNAGALDDYLAPLGDDLVRACVLGGVVGPIPTPIIMATGFRNSVTLQLWAGAGTSAGDVEELAKRLSTVLDRDPAFAHPSPTRAVTHGESTPSTARPQDESARTPMP